MKVAFRLTVILCILAIVFTIMPGSMSGDAIVAYQKSATGYTVAEQLTSVRDVSRLTPNDPAAKNVAKAFASTDIVDHIYELVYAEDIWAEGVLADSHIYEGNAYGDPRSSGAHGGDDLHLTDPGVSHGPLQWTRAIFSGNVIASYYDISWGRTVVIESDILPGLYVRYAHLGPGDCTTTPDYAGKDPYKDKIKYQNGEPMAYWTYGSGMSTISQYEKDNGFVGSNSQNQVTPRNGCTWAGGSVQVKAGDHVNVGDRVGITGTTGNSTGYHSHIEMYLDYDPDTQSLRPYSGTIPFYTYRCSPQSVLDNKGFANTTWYAYCKSGNTKYIGEALSSADIAALRQFTGDGDYSADSATNERGDPDEQAP